MSTADPGYIPPPTLIGFTAWVRAVMGISTSILPDNSQYLVMAFHIARLIVNRQMQCVVPQIYALAVYNLGGSNLINYAQDLPGAPTIPGSSPPLPYFAYARQQYNTSGFVSGIINASADESTSQSLVVQKAAEDFTLANLQQLKDPFGRQYLAFAQSMGPSVWGVN